MRRNITARLRSFYYSAKNARFAENASLSVTWSVLARLGQNPMMRATVLIPFIGTLLIFNNKITEWLNISSRFAENIGFAGREEVFTLSTLYFTYYGLCALGIGSIIYAISCPSVIQTNPDINNYVANAPAEDSPVRAKTMFWDILNIRDAYFNNNPAENKLGQYAPTLSLPDDVAGDLAILMDEMVRHSEAIGDFISDSVDQDEFHKWHVGVSAEINTDMVIAELAARRRVNRPLYEDFDMIALSMGKDLALVHFRMLDVSRFGARMVVGCFFVLGATLLFVPTVRTFFLLLSNFIATRVAWAGH